MTEDRIQINGKWYVLEKDQYDSFDPDLMTFFKGCVYETDTSCFEASALTTETLEELFNTSTFSIKYTDKRKPKDSHESELWDGTDWLRRVSERKEAIPELTKEDYEALVNMLNYLKQLNWL